jgi:hypothetical protein
MAPTEDRKSGHFITFDFYLVYLMLRIMTFTPDEQKEHREAFIKECRREA